MGKSILLLLLLILISLIGVVAFRLISCVVNAYTLPSVGSIYNMINIKN